MLNNSSNLGGLGFWIVGYGLAFGDSNNGIVGTSYFGAIGLPLESYSHLFFQVLLIISEFMYLDFAFEFNIVLNINFVTFNWYYSVHLLRPVQRLYQGRLRRDAISTPTSSSGKSDK